MPKFRVEQYEVWKSEVEVEADNMSDAIRRVLNGEGDPVDDSTEFMEMDETLGLSESQAVKFGLDEDLVVGDGFIPTIRSVKEIKND